MTWPEIVATSTTPGVMTIYFGQRELCDISEHRINDLLRAVNEHKQRKAKTK